MVSEEPVAAARPRSDAAVTQLRVTQRWGLPGAAWAGFAPRAEREDGLWQKRRAWGSAEAAFFPAGASLQHRLSCFPAAVGGSRSPVSIPALRTPGIPRAYPRPTQPQTYPVPRLPSSSRGGLSPLSAYSRSLQQGWAVPVTAPTHRGLSEPAAQHHHLHNK